MKICRSHCGPLILLMGWASGFSGVANEPPPSPLHQRIDQVVVSGNVVPVAPPADDATFARRLYLDLCGRIPGGQEVRAFLADSNANKRVHLVDQLLQSRENTLHLARTLDLWFMERRKDEHVKEEAWFRYLADAVATNKPYDELVMEILSADGTEEANRAASRFYLDRKAEPHLLTRDVGRVFFGKDLQCAQCHDHPNIDDYLQRDYYGLFAFFNRTSLFQPDTKKPALLAEKAEGEASFTSVFTKVKSESLPRIPGGQDIPDPELKPDEIYKVKPNDKDKKVRPIPVHSRRARIAEVLAQTPSDPFHRNIVNRLWKHMMGKGLVEPVDFHHASNPPSHPELLDLLARSFVEMKSDLRGFLRELALTDTYQRGFELSESLVRQATLAEARIPALQEAADQLVETARQAAFAYDDAKESWNEAVTRLNAESDTLAETVKNHKEAAAAHKKAAEESDQIKAKLASKETKLHTLVEANAKAREAVKALPDDKELAEAAAQFSARADQLQAEVKNIGESLPPKEESLRQVSAKLEEAAAAMEGQQGSVDAEEQKVGSALMVLEAARSRHRSEQTAAKNTTRRLDDARQLVAYAQARNEALSGREASDRLVTELSATQSEADTSQRRAKDLSEAAERVERVLTDSSEDAELSQALVILKDRDAQALERAAAAGQRLQEHRLLAQNAQSRADELEGAAEAAMESLTGRWTQSFALGVFEPLTPEQLCASMMQASGYLDSVHAQGNSEFDKKLKAQEEALKKKEEESPETAKAEAGDTVEKKEGAEKEEPVLSESDRTSFVEKHVREKTKGAFDQFIKLFGGQPGQPQTDFYATADQALFFANNGLVRGWLRPSGENLTARLSKMEPGSELAEEIYLNVLTREPDETEVGQVTQMLEAMPEEKSQAVQEMTWALMSSIEFRFRH